MSQRRAPILKLPNELLNQIIEEVTDEKNRFSRTQEDYEPYLTLCRVSLRFKHLTSRLMYERIQLAKNRQIWLMASMLYKRPYLGHYVRVLRIECQPMAWKGIIDLLKFFPKLQELQFRPRNETTTQDIRKVSGLQVERFIDEANIQLSELHRLEYRCAENQYNNFSSLTQLLIAMNSLNKYLLTRSHSYTWEYADPAFIQDYQNSESFTVAGLSDMLSEVWTKEHLNLILDRNLTSSVSLWLEAPTWEWEEWSRIPDTIADGLHNQRTKLKSLTLGAMAGRAIFDIRLLCCTEFPALESLHLRGIKPKVGTAQEFCNSVFAAPRLKTFKWHLTVDKLYRQDQFLVLIPWAAKLLIESLHQAAASEFAVENVYFSFSDEDEDEIGIPTKRIEFQNLIDQLDDGVIELCGKGILFNYSADWIKATMESTKVVESED